MNTAFKSLNGIALILLLSAFFVLPARSQVTIGMLEKPLPGALLDLKQNDDPAGGTTATKGMMYPRVALSSLTSLSPLDDAPASQTQYKGMTVYNVTVDAAANLQEGLYVWDGAKWSVFQTGTINNLSETYVYTLTALSPQQIAGGGADGSNGSQFHWIKNGKTYDYITLPEDGAYVFNIRLYGTTTSTTVHSTSYYLTAHINTITTNPADAQEIIVSTQDANYLKTTYSATITLAGKAKDKIYFKIGEVTGRTMGWTLLGTTTTGVTGITEKSSNRTSMIFWKI